MSLKALQGFVRIVELDSFSEAAEALFLSQSALSQQIRVLETQLKVQLFQHAQRRVVLTPAGWEFYPKAKQLLELYDDAVNCAQAAELNANPPKRHLLIGHQNMPLQMLGFDLFAATEELSTRFRSFAADRVCGDRSRRSAFLPGSLYAGDRHPVPYAARGAPRTHSIGAGGKISVDVCWNTGAIPV